LIKNMGYTAEEISIVSGGMKPIDKEREKNKFLSGKSTVLIGSSTISTGVDLQNNASALFLCSFDWNPTDNEQISGRIHRQGNRFEKIRITYPMVMNSADPNIFQQLYEKTLRIKNIWDRNDRGNTLDLKDFDVNSLRKGILDEPEDLAVYWREEQKEELETLDVVLDRRLSDLRQANLDKTTLEMFTPMMKGIIVVLDAYKKQKQKKEAEIKYREKLGIFQDEYDEKVAELKDKLENDDDFAMTYGTEIKKAKEKLEKAKEKVADEVYDFENDPEGRFTYLTYDEIGDGDDLLKNVNKFITNSDSVFTKMPQSEKYDIYGSWLNNNFPRFQEGRWDLSKSIEEDTNKLYVDIDSPTPVYNANRWKGAYRGFGKVKENLKILGIEFEEIPQAIDLINEEKSRITQELQNINQQFPIKLQEYILAKEERLVIQPTIEQRVEEFSEYNYILNEVVPTFDMDRAKVVDVPFQKLEIKPKVELIEKQIEEAVIEEEKPIVSEVDTTNLIDNLQNGLLVRFNLGSEKRGQNLIVDIFYEDGDYIEFSVIENKKGEIISESEKEISEDEVIQYYTKNYSKILEEFYDDGEGEEEIIETSKSESYNQLIEGYELALEIEMDEAKIKLFQDLIEGYQLALELEN